MNTTKNTLTKIAAAAFILLFVFASCKKKKDPHVPPDMSFKTGAGYTSGNVSIGLGDTILVGITVVKKEDDIKSYNVSYAYDGASTTTTFYNYLMTSAEYTGYSKDLQIIARNVAGSERWVFTIVDRDGNLAQKTITLTVH